MQNNRFVVLTGHLSNYPLSDLIGILRHQKKSGRLLIEYPKGPATLFFEEGELVDVRLNELAGLQAICVLVAQPDAAFNFNPLIRASQRSIDGSFQRVVSELFGCWDESALQIDGVSVMPVLQLNPNPADQNAATPLEGRSVEPLALPPAPPISTLRQRSVLMAAAAVLIVIGISTVIAVTGSLKKSEMVSEQPATAPNSSAQALRTNQLPDPVARATDTTRVRQTSDSRRESRLRTSESSPKSETPTKVAPAAAGNEKVSESPASSSGEAIKVVMHIENGRVLNASIANHAPGMDGFEALALRIARQRRYPAAKNGAETVTISVNKPE
ncbi:MAG TPA: DUF4388 domain-containing protein [Pyrinomonadaceae bacterium]|jgi:hypothetical protein|nr:DUF4388 domain-containing protein [Pyrinomonadaceae bacterium]